jgi:DNA polymerase-3 subunit delta'
VAESQAPWPLAGHAAVLAGLWRAASVGRLPHALLFTGPQGLGKFRAARAFAQGLLCALGPRETGPCGSCGPCKRFLADGHPDLHVIDPPREIDEQIRVGYIVRREGSSESDAPADEFLALKPMEGGWRIVIVRDAERMIEQAQNALLKMLEEPGDFVLWILVCARPADLLATVTSRIVPVRFAPLEQSAALALLERHGLSRDEAAQLARWAGGSPGSALSMSERSLPAMRAILVAVLCGEQSPLAAAAMLAQLDGRFEGKTPAGRERERARSVLELAVAMLGDVARLHAGMPAQSLPHGDLQDCLHKMAGAQQPNLLSLAVEALCTLRADIDLNLDPGAALERATLVLAARQPAQILC